MENIKSNQFPEGFPLPKELVDQISMICESNGYGLALLGDRDNGVHMIMIGNGQLSPDEAAVYMAHVLLTSVVHGHAREANQALLERQEEGTDKTKVN